MNINILRRFHDLIKEKNYTSLEVASKEIGFSEPYLYNTFSLKHNPSFRVLNNIEEKLGFKKGSLCVHYTKTELEKMSLERLKEYAKRYERGVM